MIRLARYLTAAINGTTPRVINKAGVCLLLSMALSITNAQAEIVWHWQDPFTPQEKTQLKHWVSKTTAAVEQTVAPFPFDVHVYFHRMAGKGEPVPWANTRRRPNQAIHFHVDPSYSLRQFLQDWTAPHELSHLLIPYVGQDYSWFAEGFASYLQYRVMHTLGVLTLEQVSQKTHAKISQAQGKYIYHKIPFHYAAQILRESKQYPVYYWGGAAFFQSLDARLQREQSSLVAVLKDYLACCRLQAKGLSDLVATLDRLAPAQVFAPALQTATTEAGFPLWE